METKTEKPSIVIGIDPDVDGSGVGVIDLLTHEVTKLQLRLPELVDYLKGLRGVAKVFIEAGWMNHGNYHLKNKGQHHASKIGEQIGRNHEVSKIIGEFCQHNKIQFIHVAPLKKHWRGKDGKITHDELINLLECSGVVVKKPMRTNQETRDAILLALVHSGIPLRTRISKHKE